MRWQIKFWIKAAIIIIIALAIIVWSAITITVLIANKMI